MDTCLQVVNARPDAQSRCRRAARSRAELVVVWCTCREQKGMPEHTVSERLPSQLSAWAHQLLRNMCRRDDQACAVQGSWRCTWARPPHLESRHPDVRPTTRELRELKGCPRTLLPKEIGAAILLSTCRPCAERVRRGRSDRSGEGQMGRSAMWRAG